MKYLFILLLGLAMAPTSQANTLKCLSADKSVELEITTNAFTTVDYAGTATLRTQGLTEYNIQTDRATYFKPETNAGYPVIGTSLPAPIQGDLVVVFKDSLGQDASVQFVNWDEEYTTLAVVHCQIRSSVF